MLNLDIKNIYSFYIKKNYIQNFIVFKILKIILYDLNAGYGKTFSRNFARHIYNLN